MVPECSLSLFAYLHIIFLKFTFNSIFNSDSVGHPCVRFGKASSLYAVVFTSLTCFHFPLPSWRFSHPSTCGCWDGNSSLVSPIRTEGERMFKSVAMFFSGISKRPLLHFATQRNKSVLDTLGLRDSMNQ